jgi:hypothetical protein
MQPELWHRCELRLRRDDGALLTRTDFVKHPSALVGTVFPIRRERWVIFSVQHPGKPLGLVREEMAVLTARH